MLVDVATIGGTQMTMYRVIGVAPQQANRALNEFARNGWRVVTASVGNIGSPGNTVEGLIAVLEHPTAAPDKLIGEAEPFDWGKGQ
jgi:hypothetical protein